MSSKPPGRRQPTLRPVLVSHVVLVVLAIGASTGRPLLCDTQEQKRCEDFLAYVSEHKLSPFGSNGGVYVAEVNPSEPEVSASGAGGGDVTIEMNEVLPMPY